ncbi:MAG: M1 family metallopeptidase, partial [Gemmatimonadetes bacterium]|nr:M1 family metallopeptidase [Gemmatimonadota bacterium]
MRRAGPLLAALALTGCAGLAFGPWGRTVPEGPPAIEPPPVQAGVAPPPGPYAPGIDVLHYRVELGLPDTASWIQGRARLRVLLAEPAPAAMALDITGLAVDRLTVGDEEIAGPFELADGELTVPLAGAAGDSVDVEVLYRGVPDDGLILGSTVHGRPSAFADNWPNRARFWFPSVDHPSDKATVEFIVHAPARWEVVANGVTDGPVPTPPGALGPADGPRRTWHWRTALPIPTYTMVVGGTEMVVDTVGLAACGSAPASPREDGCVAVSTWLFPPDTAQRRTSFARAARMVDVFTGMVGPFPYAKLAHVQSSTRFGGMENASAIFYSEGGLASGRDIEGTVVHETAHQWFGDAVTESDWHELWLSEGFATYFTALFYEAEDGQEAFRERMAGTRARYMASDVVDRPLVDPEVTDLFELLNANSYQKGGWVLHMLRRELGEGPFWRAIRGYAEANRGRSVITEDLRAAVEEATGRNLEWFFQQWVHAPGHPELEIGWSHDEDEGLLAL